uniref:Uncharacterized protein n=1 Tax=Rhizophora mucronata TaxID=61149 RepID=A0A2P2J236_RHIMU
MCKNDFCIYESGLILFKLPLFCSLPSSFFFHSNTAYDPIASTMALYSPPKYK